MKKILFVALLSTITCSSFAQFSKDSMSLYLTHPYTSTAAGTNMEELNYATKGYITTLEQGLDIKKGYQVEDLTNHFFMGYRSPYKMKVVLLYRVNQDKSKY